jgi:hypothetical protein
MIGKVCHAILWFLGFPAGEHISDMLARQKLRLGKGWWAFPILTIAGFLTVAVWLTIHIATFKLRRKE